MIHFTRQGVPCAEDPLRRAAAAAAGGGARGRRYQHGHGHDVVRHRRDRPVLRYTGSPPLSSYRARPRAEDPHPLLPPPRPPLPAEVDPVAVPHHRRARPPPSPASPPWSAGSPRHDREGRVVPVVLRLAEPRGQPVAGDRRWPHAGGVIANAESPVRRPGRAAGLQRRHPTPRARPPTSPPGPSTAAPPSTRSAPPPRRRRPPAGRRHQVGLPRLLRRRDRHRLGRGARPDATPPTSTAASSASPRAACWSTPRTTCTTRRLAWSGPASSPCRSSAWPAPTLDLTPYLSAYGLAVYKRLQTGSIVNALGAYPGLTWQQLAKPQYPNPDSAPAFVEAVNKINLGCRPHPDRPRLHRARATAACWRAPSPRPASAPATASWSPATSAPWPASTAPPATARSSTTSTTCSATPARRSRGRRWPSAVARRPVAGQGHAVGLWGDRGGKFVAAGGCGGGGFLRAEASSRRRFVRRLQRPFYGFAHGAMTSRVAQFASLPVATLATGGHG